MPPDVIPVSVTEVSEAPAREKELTPAEKVMAGEIRKMGMEFSGLKMENR